jgi:proteic killer suppression protein
MCKAFKVSRSGYYEWLKRKPSNRLEKLVRNLKDFHSIRINSQWRINFQRQNGNAVNVEIMDFHK